MNATETPIQLTVKCAWCGKLIKGGKPWPPESLVSHGICKNCLDRERVVIGRIVRRTELTPSA